MLELSVQLYTPPVRLVNHFGPGDACGFGESAASPDESECVWFLSKKGLLRTHSGRE
jgi:hypothetical protein